MPKQTLQYLAKQHQSYCDWALNQLPNLSQTHSLAKEQELLELAKSIAEHPLVSQELPNMIFDHEVAMAAWLAMFSSESIEPLARLLCVLFDVPLQSNATTQNHPQNGAPEHITAEIIDNMLKAYSFVSSMGHLSYQHQGARLSLKQAIQSICLANKPQYPVAADYYLFLVGARSHDINITQQAWEGVQGWLIPSWAP